MTLFGLSGYALVAVLCCLLIIEEVGIPLPVFPGDFLLALAGISIGTGHLNPLLVMAATYISVLVGAVAGRELFERLGMKALSRITRVLHVSDRVDRLAAGLRRCGAPAVFIGRITPGLRVHTNEVSGLIKMPRSKFVVGLAPAVAVYEAVFLGAGAWLGPTALATVHRHMATAGELLVIVVLVFALVLAGRRLVSRVRRRARGPERRGIGALPIQAPLNTPAAVEL